MHIASTRYTQLCDAAVYCSYKNVIDEREAHFPNPITVVLYMLLAPCSNR